MHNLTHKFKRILDQKNLKHTFFQVFRQERAFLLAKNTTF
ncbi:hypothetical protein LEP1GSC103_2017 [Leptospira borgpetersenii serovar Javanica str. UI 09931]|uniref:Uncharacterized protein n=4 Tax=Leptospira borgpetersenii TaxID=174 RepID=M3HT86_LEPBO|nr:hypothetical protein LEP1GSC128_0881 [Leptospira borgpetersenii str. 200801926]EKQ91612.1 hypothetical protein LEP1GSC101_0777 [Leptospira borgpetersenii str. UI 09149]EMG00830.1 hypothetical protein LEP1GSC123_0562 [Leptospira borgpetersenii str. 200701203]EMK14474.1 hypothetical protein LEP1GSC066_2237 [Leptospira sp. serovar Kenya str. Sh9]EMN17953.1 hypothetical protein LEP1GSC056_0310 [Leptospira borgpetersenii str. Brem 328]EMN59919.1 hypothetical protein LEP1GSC090_2097 [Leptospira b